MWKEVLRNLYSPCRPCHSSSSSYPEAHGVGWWDEEVLGIVYLSTDYRRAHTVRRVEGLEETLG